MKWMTIQMLKIKVVVAEGHMVEKKGKVSAIMALCFSSNGVSQINLLSVPSCD